MALPSIFDASTTTQLLERLNKISADTKPNWGKMNAGQLMAHLNIAYDICYGKIGKKPNFIVKWALKKFVKSKVVGEEPYKKNGQTSPEFIIKGDRDFEKEKAILIKYIKETEQKGAAYFEGRESISFGELTAREWSNQFYKHLDHHFTQFGV